MDCFSAMTANLRFGRAQDGEHGWEFRKDAFLELFRTYKPDILAVQEANDFQAEHLIQRLEEYDCAGFRKNAPDFWQSNILFFKKPWALKKHRHIFYSDTPDEESKWEDSKWPRQGTLVQLEKDGKTLACVDTHYDFKPEVQARSARLLLNVLEEFAPGLPTLVMGDFNAKPDSSCRKEFEQGGFQDPFDRRFGGTHHNFTGKDDGRRIDWILYRGGIEPVKASRKIVRDRFCGVYPSDHFQVYCEFTWKS
ncbi:Metal-dependent hydrolase, endonuclease/exonuclease/phosphatase family [Desulfatibacillum alkenivorans DSM 16219]|jgi:endonuclease/exonuclease/phosphatase family metal-dependent hydrolase|uniref:Metal-dependent hydrolase, endonuclease/exonuclease/phosphatase family n=1 Tax=Desulfatibacillum alkenivorans DSM 16219 TaxID=1121393 RepID=A0A1M6DYP6_9BACT|nr:endonuclease/exonuclease/phosphatase family protein [Desulfatibacillum alkenivorans]SHI78384.1 Metal-dependent hydrolase, endonuclease/exonuclease/phosphatase family [Desulfatibacillum alkenivorans DSM 16219]